MGTLGRLAFIIGLAATAGAAGCFLSQADEETGGTDDEVNAGGDVSNILKSTLMLETGCMATKVGPRHLLTAARCVVGKSDYEAGKTLKYKVAATSVNNIIGAPIGSVVGRETDAGSKDAGKDGSSSSPPAGGSTNGMRDATIAEINVHASYTAKCKEQACAFTAIGASDAKDIAVIVLDADLETVPTVPVDLGTVGQADPVIALASGCSKVDGTPTKLKSIKTIAVPAKSVNHAGSAYTAEPQLVTRLNSGYVVSPGLGWPGREDEPNICANDIGAPMFRGDTAAVVGVTSNFTVFDKTKLVPVTIHSTRTDSASKVGMWLKEMGVETVDTCGEEGCAKRDFDGGVPTQTTTGSTTPSGDGGTLTDGGTTTPKKDSGKEEEKDPPSTDLPDQGEESTLPPSAEDQYQPKEPNSGEGYDAGPKKKKKKAAEGCSFAPATSSGSNAPLGGFGLIGMGIGVAAAIRRRRSR
jgi:hypothetical protein